MSSGQAGPGATALNRQLLLVTMESQPEAVGQQILGRIPVHCCLLCSRYHLLDARRACRDRINPLSALLYEDLHSVPQILPRSVGSRSGLPDRPVGSP
jgi:hypothetical protein